MTPTGLAFVVAYLGGLIAGLVVNPLYALFTYVGEFYVYPPSRWWGAYLPDLRWSLLAAAVTIVAAVRYRPNDARPPWISTTPAKLLLAYTIWLWIQSFWALDPVQHFGCAVLFSKYLVVYYVVYHLVDTPQKAKAFLFAHLAGCLYLGLIAHGSSVHGRLDGVGGPGIDDSNTLGMHIATGALTGAILLLLEKRWWVALSAIALAVALSLNTMILTGSRGAFLALISGATLLFYLRPKIYRTKFAIFGVCSVLVFGALASQQFWGRMKTLNTVVEDNRPTEASAESRIVLAKAQLKMARRYPLGTGHRGTEFLSPQYLAAKWLTASGARSSHNTFLTALVEQGIPGVVLYFGYLIWGFNSVRRLKRLVNSPETTDLGMYGVAAACSLMIVLVGGMFADFLKVEVQIWMAALLSAVLEMSVASARQGAIAATGVATVRVGSWVAGPTRQKYLLSGDRSKNANSE